MKLIYLKNASIRILEEYVNLRNKYVKELNTKKVTLKETLNWLEEANVIIIGIEENQKLLGAGIIYLDKNNQFSYFSKHISKGIGTVLLEKIEEVAANNKLEKLWAQVNIDNIVSIKCLEKNRWIVSKNKNGKIYFTKKLNTDKL